MNSGNKIAIRNWMSLMFSWKDNLFWSFSIASAVEAVCKALHVK